MKPRAQRNIVNRSVKVYFGDKTMDGVLRDLSEGLGGCWVETADPLAFLDTLDDPQTAITVTLSESLHLRGEIRWGGYHPIHRVSGLGVEVNQ